MAEEEKEPQEFSEWFVGVGQKLKNLLEKNRADRAAGLLTPREKLIELYGAISRAERTRQFLDSVFWKDDLEPFLRGEAKLKPWVPGDAIPIEEAATTHLYNSGKVYVLTRIMTRFGEWIKAGDEAAVVIKREEDIRKKTGVNSRQQVLS